MEATIHGDVEEKERLIALGVEEIQTAAVAANKEETKEKRLRWDKDQKVDNLIRCLATPILMLTK